MRIDVSYLVRLTNEYRSDGVREAVIGDGIILQCIWPIIGSGYIAGSEWWEDVLKHVREDDRKDFKQLEARLTLDEGYTHRFCLSVENASPDFTDPRINRAKQRLIQAIVLSRIVKPTPIASDSPKIITCYPSDGSPYHQTDSGYGSYSTAYTARGKREFINEDAARMAEMWDSYKQFFDEEPKYRRIVRALEFFNGAFHIWNAEFSHIILHAALESLICTRRNRNRKQVTKRLPHLVPSVTEEQARKIYELCCDFKHTAAPLYLSPTGSASLVPSDQRRHEATMWLETALCELFSKAIDDRNFANMLADKDKLEKELPI